MFCKYLISIIMCQFIIRCQQIRIPLSYALDPNTSHKYPIKFSFNTSETVTPFESPYLSLYNVNIAMQTKRSNKQIQYVQIGLKYPSIFLTAVEQTYKVQSKYIEIGKQEYAQLIIDGNNFVQSTDTFTNGQLYEVRVMQNFGDALSIQNQRCFLIDDDQVYFDQFLIIEILTVMQKKNNIQYKQNQKLMNIQLFGTVQNFPKISFRKDHYIFEVENSKNIINYIPRNNKSQAVNHIGYKALTKFSKFQISGENPNIEDQDHGHNSINMQKNMNKITFKRTSQLYQLYIFLGYFFVLTVLFIVKQRQRLEDSMKFVRSVVDWVLFHNRQARINVLRTQLQ